MDMMEDIEEIASIAQEFYTSDHHERIQGKDLYGGRLNLRLPKDPDTIILNQLPLNSPLL